MYNNIIILHRMYRGHTENNMSAVARACTGRIIVYTREQLLRARVTILVLYTLLLRVFKPFVRGGGYSWILCQTAIKSDVQPRVYVLNLYAVR